jgi:polyhydroxybutyrate depolymerase
MRTTFAWVFVALAACNNSSAPFGSDAGSGGDGSFAAADMALPAGDMGMLSARPYNNNLYVPAGYDAAKPAPLVILLHGYTATGAEQELYFNLKPVADAHTFLYVYPDGTKDSLGNQFWNATDACCDIFGAKPADDEYLMEIVRDIQSKFNVDSKRIYLIGHSNGAFMSHRMACAHSDVFAAIAPLAGDTWKDQSKCAALEAVGVLQIQGDADATIAYGGGGPLWPQGGTYPGSVETAADWATKNGCTGSLTDTGTSLDIDTALANAETGVSKYTCTHGAVELWTIHGGGHLPSLHTDPTKMPTWGELLYGWLSQHSKP